ncbi:unnamed protein product, partial [Tetraodon nigroviridis]
AVTDLTMISTANVTSVAHFAISCINGERSTAQLDLDIKRDNKIFILSKPPNFKVHKKRNRVVEARDFREFDHIGIFYCQSTQEVPSLEKITMINNFNRANFVPGHLTLTVNRGETVHLSMLLLGSEKRDVTWKYNGNYHYMTHWNEMVNRTAVLTLENVAIANRGIYSASYMGDTPLHGAWMRLIVRGFDGDALRDRPLRLLLRQRIGLGLAVRHASRTIMDSNKSTAVFEIPQLNAQQGGLWECRVSTNGGQDSRKFNLTVKEPPVPTTVPTLLEKKSKQLLVLPGDTYRGDGPILFTKILYKPEKNGNSWSSIIVYSDKKPITLMNLEPSTRYHVCVQLSRPGEGGEGAPGPETIMETDCPEPTVQPEIDISSVEGRNATVRWRLPANSGVNARTASGFLVQLYGPPPHSEKLQEETTVLNVLSTRFHNLEYQRDYTVVVRLVNCGSQGPPSKPYQFRIHSQGPSSPRNVQAVPLSISAIRVRWQPPDDPNGGIIKYIIEYQAVGQGSPHLGSTLYQFRVRAFSKVPGEWSIYVQAMTQGDGKQEHCPQRSPLCPGTVCLYFPPSLPLKFFPLCQKGLEVILETTKAAAGTAAGDNYQLLVAVVGSVTVTCVTILLALLALFFIRKMLLNRRRTFTYQSGSGEETILQFNSGTLTLTRRPKPTPEALTYPILEWEDIKFEDVIGEGNFGQVIKAMVKKDGNKMSAAIKMLKEFASENDHRDFAGELEVLCKLGQHPNIINLIGACENRGYLYIAIEYAPYGNLLDFLRKSRVLETDPAFAKEHGTASTLTSQQLLQFAVDVATGMHYLSDKQFIHRDLAARNVLVGDNLVAKIADFGLSRGEEVYVKKTMGRLPVRWMAIESLNYSVYTTKSDVWSFGVLLWEIVSLGGTPYCGMTCAELYEKLPQGFRMEKPKNCDDEVYELMKQCWRDRPYERPPFSQISVQLSRMQEARKAYVNMALFENFTYAGIDATAEEA